MPDDNDLNVSSINTDTSFLQILNQLASWQAMVVIWTGEPKVRLYLYEKTGEGWQLVGHMPAIVGRNGMEKTREGDAKSPSGLFSLGTGFGILPPPDGCRYPYRLVTSGDYWVDDSQAGEYNQWVHYRDGEPKDWNSAERLWEETGCYRHAVVINYNTDREPGKGSAIFFHVWAGEDTPTQGCTAVSYPDMVRILQWLDPEANPVIIQGSPSDIQAFAESEGKRSQ